MNEREQEIIEEFVDYIAFAYKGGFQGIVCYEVHLQGGEVCVFYFEVDQHGHTTRHFGEPPGPSRLRFKMTFETFEFCFFGVVSKMQLLRVFMSNSVQITEGHYSEAVSFVKCINYNRWDEFYKKRDKKPKGKDGPSGGATVFKPSVPSLPTPTPIPAAAAAFVSAEWTHRQHVGLWGVWVARKTLAGALCSTRGLQLSLFRRHTNTAIESSVQDLPAPPVPPAPCVDAPMLATQSNQTHTDTPAPVSSRHRSYVCVRVEMCGGPEWLHRVGSWVGQRVERVSTWLAHVQRHSQ